MNLFSRFKNSKKKNSEIIATVEEEDIVNEEVQTQSTPVVVEPVVENTVEEPVEEIVEEPVEEVAEEVTEEPVEEVAEEVTEEPVEEVAEEVTEEPVEEVVEEVVEEPVEEVVEEVTEEPVEEVAEPIEDEWGIPEAGEESTDEVIPVIIPEISEANPVEEESKEPMYQATFAEKMNIADDNIQNWYNEIKNYALRFKKLTTRISKKYDSINQGRLQFVKISLAGKTLKLNLNMDIEQCNPKYHCVDKKSTKTYEDVPVQMRIKSDRGVKYGKELIDQCAQMHGLVENPKFKPVDAIQLIRDHLELGNTDDLVIEYNTDDEE